MKVRTPLEGYCFVLHLFYFKTWVFFFLVVRTGRYEQFLFMFLNILSWSSVNSNFIIFHVFVSWLCGVYLNLSTFPVFEIKNSSQPLSTKRLIDLRLSNAIVWKNFFLLLFGLFAFIGSMTLCTFLPFKSTPTWWDFFLQVYGVQLSCISGMIDPLLCVRWFVLPCPISPPHHTSNNPVFPLVVVFCQFCPFLFLSFRLCGLCVFLHYISA